MAMTSSHTLATYSFTDREALERYGPHPEHVPVKEYVAKVCEDVIAIDYEF